MKIFKTILIFHLLLLTLLGAVVRSESNKPIAIVHVGPPKTRSSWIQTIFLQECMFDLSKINFYPLYHDHSIGKNEAFIPETNCLDKRLNISGCDEILTSAKSKIDEHLLNRRNIIIFSEGLASKFVDINYLFTLLKGFEIRVAIFHRELINLLISNHNQWWKFFNTTSALRDIFDSLSKKDQLGFTAPDIFKRLSQFLPQSQLYIFDYYGILQSGNDVAAVVIQTMFDVDKNKLKFIIDKILALKQNTGKVNESEDIRLFQLKFIVQEMLGVIFSSSLTTCFFRETDERGILGELPLKCVDLKDLESLKNKSIENNEILNKSERVFYGNFTENMRKISSFVIPSISNRLCDLDIALIRTNENFYKKAIKQYEFCKQRTGLEN